MLLGCPTKPTVRQRAEVKITINRSRALLLSGLLLVEAVVLVLFFVTPRAPVPASTASAPSLSDPRLSGGGRLVAEEALPSPDGRAMFPVRQLLLTYLARHSSGDLQSALQLCRAAAAHTPGWLPSLYEAYCLELLKRPAEAREVMRTRQVDPDVYAYLFHNPRDSVSAVLAKIQWSDCVRILQYVLQEAELYTARQGQPPTSLEAMFVDADQTVAALLTQCPCGKPYEYSIVASRPHIRCRQHEQYDLPELAAPDTVFGPAVAKLEVDCHVYEQLAWKAQRTDEQALAIYKELETAAQLQPGQEVADVGSGIGFYSFAMRDRVGSRGEVWAVDVKPSVLEYVEFVSKRHPRRAVRTLISQFNDTLLPAEHFDAVFLAHVYRRLTSVERTDEEYRTTIRPFVESIRKGLKRGGVLVIMDGEASASASILTVARKLVVKEIAPLGFEWLQERDRDGIRGDTPNDYVMVFRKR